MTAVGRDILTEDITTKEVVHETESIETTLTAALDSHTTTPRVTAHSKRWRTADGTAKWKAYGRTRRPYKKGRTNASTLRAERNSYYYMVHRSKRQYWAAFLQGADEVIGESNRCWTALRYTRRWSTSITLVL